VLVVDLDNFKAVNDRHGHDVGDQLLIGVAEEMKRQTRATDTFARLGGDEFVGLVASDDQAHIDGLVRRIKATIERAYLTSEGEFQVTASIGVSLYPQDGAEPDVLLRHADHAMYQAKESGKSTVRYFDSRRHDSNQRRRNLLEDIDQALADDQFELYFQPRFSLRTGELAGAEALPPMR